MGDEYDDARHAHALIYSLHADIRTYSVVPLNEECGLIEWVPHVVVLRGVLAKRYASMNVAAWVSPGGREQGTRHRADKTVLPQSPDLKRIFDTIRDDPKKTAERFETEVLKK